MRTELVKRSWILYGYWWSRSFHSTQDARRDSFALDGFSESFGLLEVDSLHTQHDLFSEVFVLPWWRLPSLRGFCWFVWWLDGKLSLPGLCWERVLLQDHGVRGDERWFFRLPSPQWRTCWLSLVPLLPEYWSSRSALRSCTADNHDSPYTDTRPRNQRPRPVQTVSIYLWLMRMMFDKCWYRSDYAACCSADGHQDWLASHSWIFDTVEWRMKYETHYFHGSVLPSLW